MIWTSITNLILTNLALLVYFQNNTTYFLLNIKTKNSSLDHYHSTHFISFYFIKFYFALIHFVSYQFMIYSSVTFPVAIAYRFKPSRRHYDEYCITFCYLPNTIIQLFVAVFIIEYVSRLILTILSIILYIIKSCEH